MTSLAVLVDKVSGWKTYIAAVGLLGLTVYQLSVGQFDMAGQTFLASLATVGLRHAVAKNDPAPAK